MTTFFTDLEAAGGGEFLDTAEVGIRFTLPAGTINYLRVYWPAVAPGGTPVVHLWNGAGTLVQTVNFDTTTLSAWNNATPTTPIAVTAGTYYVSWGTTRYKAIVGFFSGGSVARGSITAVEGRFASVGSFPASTSAAAYVADLDFTPSGGGATPALTDTGAAADSLGVTVAVALPETGSAADSRTSTATSPLSDAAGATDATSATATAPLADAGSATDSLSNGAGTPKPVGDSAGAADSVAVTVAAAVADVAAAAEALTVAAAAALGDAGSAVQALAVAAISPLADVATATQALAVAAALPLADSGAAADAGQGADGTNLSRSFGDSGAASDQIRARRTTLRPHLGTTARPNAGVTARP